MAVPGGSQFPGGEEGGVFGPAVSLGLTVSFGIVAVVGTVVGMGAVVAFLVVTVDSIKGGNVDPM